MQWFLSVYLALKNAMPMKMMQQTQDGKDDDEPGAAGRPLQTRGGLDAQFRHDIGRDEPDGEHDAQGHDEEIVEITEHGNEIGDQVDRR